MSIDSKARRILVLAYAVLVLVGNQLYAHDSLVDLTFGELNGYLTAIQIMRFKNEEALELFKTWQVLRAES